jgi:hypothetical protein
MDARYGRSEEGARVHGVHHRFRCVENARVFGFLTTFSLLLCVVRYFYERDDGRRREGKFNVLVIIDNRGISLRGDLKRSAVCLSS